LSLANAKPRLSLLVWDQKISVFDTAKWKYAASTGDKPVQGTADMFPHLIWLWFTNYHTLITKKFWEEFMAPASLQVCLTYQGSMDY